MSINDIRDKLKSEPDLEKKKALLKNYFNNGSINFSDYRDLLNETVRRCAPMSSNDSSTLMGFSTFKEKSCDCGAKHTSFPSHHYEWCQMRV